MRLPFFQSSLAGRAMLMVFLFLATIAEGLCGNAYQSPLTGQNKIDWFIVNFKDHGDGTFQQDYNGGFQTYIGHGGIDIWFYDYKAMDSGIEVLAAAPGTVVYVQDKIYEMWPGVNYMFPAPYIQVRHTDGSQALYYHIRHGSAAVTNGQTVTTGQKLAFMGPHLHFEVQNASGVSQEIMTNEAGHAQSFAWFDSYSNQVIRQVIGMGITKTNDLLLRQDFFEQTPLSYTRIHSGPFTPWIKYVGLSKTDKLTIRLLAESGPGWTLDLTDWPMQWMENLKCSYAYWYVWSLVGGTTYRMQYRWNDDEWTNAPGNSIITVDDAASEEYTSRYSPHYTRYVNAGSRTPQAPYTSWETAADTIQAAIDVSQDGDLIIVSNGVYDAGSTLIQGSATRVAVTKAIAVRSVNGPYVTIIKGNGPVGPDAVRCAYVTNSAFLAGFTLTNGAVSGRSAGADNGGGVFCEPYAGVVNCIISGCIASNGGGVYGGILQNCLVAGNTALDRGGGTYLSEIAYSTIADNTAADGGGCWGGYMFSCIAWYNTAATQTSNFVFGPGSWVWYSCTMPEAAGYMNITNDPVFADRSAFDYRLSASSPCIDHGSGSASWALDIDHAARIVNLVPDMGAYEYSPLPPAPWWIAANAAERHRVRVEWNAVPRASGYRVWRNTQNYTWTASPVGATAATSLYDTLSAPGVLYYYWVQATNSAGTGAFSIATSMRCRNIVPGMLRCDFDGDGASEMAVFDEVNGDWYALSVSNTVTLWQSHCGWAGATPVPDDYDGDGIADKAVYDETTAQWVVNLSQINDAQAAALFGGPGWAPAPQDYDGDYKIDPAVYSQSDGTWWAMLSHAGYETAGLAGFGASGYGAAQGDYDGDGKSDPAVYSPPLGALSVMLSGSGYQQVSASFGGTGMVSVTADYDGDGKSDPAVYGIENGVWMVMLSGRGYHLGAVVFGGSGYDPVPGDYDGDAKADICLYQESTGLWVISLSGRDYDLFSAYFGGLGFPAVGAVK